MRSLDSLPNAVKDQLQNKDVIVFDGECVLCSGFFRFMERHDKAQRFSFVIAQSELGGALYSAFELPTDDFETNLVIMDGQVFEKLDAFAAAMRALGWPWSVLGICQYFPNCAKNAFYNQVARNRYRIFGRYDRCLVPTEELRARFLANGMDVR